MIQYTRSNVVVPEDSRHSHGMSLHATLILVAIGSLASIVCAAAGPSTPSRQDAKSSRAPYPIPARYFSAASEPATGSRPATFDPLTPFEQVWKQVDEGFWDPQFNGVDWQKAHDTYLPRVRQCTTQEQLATVINEMLGLLKTSHMKYVTTSDVTYYVLSSLGEPAKAIGRCGIGMDVRQIDGQWFVTGLLADDEAERAGVQVGDHVLAVNGRPFHPVNAFRGLHRRQVTLAVERKPGEAPVQLRVTPSVATELERLEKASSARMLERDGIKIGYIRQWWLGDTLAGSSFTGKIQSLMATGAQALIVDLRDGFGGHDPVLYDILRTLFSPPLGTAQTYRRGRPSQTFALGGTNLPLILLINNGTRSAKEVLAYYCKKRGRAVLVGETTAGCVVAAITKRVTSDAVLLYAVEMNEYDGVRLEGHGVAPDILVPFDVRYCNGRDPQLQRAEEEAMKMIAEK